MSQHQRRTDTSVNFTKGQERVRAIMTRGEYKKGTEQLGNYQDPSMIHPGLKLPYAEVTL